MNALVTGAESEEVDVLRTAVAELESDCQDCQDYLDETYDEIETNYRQFRREQHEIDRLAVELSDWNGQWNEYEEMQYSEKDAEEDVREEPKAKSERVKENKTLFQHPRGEANRLRSRVGPERGGGEVLLMTMMTMMMTTRKETIMNIMDFIIGLEPATPDRADIMMKCRKNRASDQDSLHCDSPRRARSR